MREFQSTLGEMQDAEVFLQTLRHFQPKSGADSPDPVVRYYEERHTRAISACPAQMDLLNTFWRAEARLPFSWAESQPMRPVI